MIDNLGKYYEWADNRIIALLETLEEELFIRNLEGTGNSLRGLTEHLIVYYEYFVFRKTRIPFKSLQEKLKIMDKQELLNHWGKVIKEFSKAIENTKEDFIDIPLPNSETTKVSKDEYLFCYTDHATYHRGQLITTYKAITGEKALNTDYYDFLIDHLKNE